jgi:hypothetical protein
LELLELLDYWNEKAKKRYPPVILKKKPEIGWFKNFAMHGNSSQKVIKIDFFFRDKMRNTQTTVVNSHEGACYWFHFKSGPPNYLNKKNGTWYLGGTRPLSDGIEQVDMWRALAKAIDEQIIGKPLTNP